MRTQKKNNNTQRAGKRGFSIASDWFRKWREFSGPMIERKESQISFDMQLTTPLPGEYKITTSFCFLLSLLS